MKQFNRIPLLCKTVPLGIVLSVFFSINVSAAQPGIITVDNVNIRTSPSTEAEILSQADEGQSVTILSTHGDFYMINTDTLSNVFISRAFIERKEAAGQLRGTANYTSVNIRSGSSTTSDIIGVASEGDTFTILVNVDGWYRISYNSQPAYIFGEFLTIEAVSEEAAQNVAQPESAELASTSQEFGDNAMPSDFAALLASVMYVVYIAEESTEVAALAHENTNENNYIESAMAQDNAIERTFNPQSNVHAIVSSSTGLNLREHPTTESASITILHPAQSLNIYDIFSDWAHVSTMDGLKRGYVNVEFITVRTGNRQAPPEPNAEKAQQIIYFARMFIGTPYRFGGTDLQTGVDCSGFIFSIMREFGITLGRSSRDMINNGIPIEREDIAPGDLLFFSANGTVVTHVALYMGNNQFIHSTDTRGLGVSFASLTSEHSLRTFFGARRVIQ